MRLHDLIDPANIALRVRVGTKSELLKDLARRASEAVGIDESLVHRALVDREKLGSTGVGGSIALPHARLRDLDKTCAVFVTLDRPIDFQSIDEAAVDLVCMLLMPDEPRANSNAALACVSRRLREQGVAAKLRQAKSPGELYAAFLG